MTPALFEPWRQRVDHHLRLVLERHDPLPEPLRSAIHYALIDGGKRIRPLLGYATATLLQLKPEAVDDAMVAVEMIHAYSLVHDDLPAMDDDDLRRGQPTCHRAFGEATAILAGDALQTLAFQTLTDSDTEPTIRLSWLQQLTRASGPAGMIGGQMIDLEAEQHPLDESGLLDLHSRKTGALITASIIMAATPAHPTATTLKSLQQFAAALGLAFQIQDDILDQIGESQITGKPQGSDQQQGKSTFVTLYGIDGAQTRLRQQQQQALQGLARLPGDTTALHELTRFIIERNH